MPREPQIARPHPHAAVPQLTHMPVLDPQMLSTTEGTCDPPGVARVYADDVPSTHARYPVPAQSQYTRVTVVDLLCSGFSSKNRLICCCLRSLKTPGCGPPALLSVFKGFSSILNLILTG